MIWDKIPWVEILLIFCALSLFWIYYDARRFHKYMVNALHKETKRRNTHDSMIYELIAKISSKGDSEIKLKNNITDHMLKRVSAETIKMRHATTN